MGLCGHIVLQTASAQSAGLGTLNRIPARLGEILRPLETRGTCYAVTMSIDVVDLRNFYAQRLGVVARRFVGRGIRRRFADTRGMSGLGVAYPTPSLGLFAGDADRSPPSFPPTPG